LSNGPKGLKGLGQGVGALGGLFAGQVTRNGMSVIGTGPNLTPKGRVVTIPMSAPFQVITGLVILDDSFFHLAISRTRGTSQGLCNRCIAVMVTSGRSSPGGLTGVLKLP
jgi:hypothetical protein